MAPRGSPEDLLALVDMGSNGIRMSITDMAAETSRILPTMFQDRCPISLYDAQYPDGTDEQRPVPNNIIMEVVNALRNFASICRDFGVHNANVRVVATEATRNAINRDDLLARIYNAVGWKTELLPKEEEGRLGAVGVASSLHQVSGLAMDMGGGSVQLTELMRPYHGTEELYVGKSVSLPFGAAALTAHLVDGDNDGRQEYFNHVKSELCNALSELGMISRSSDQLLGLYLSGGGFRGWGQIMMSTDANQPYPIPIINGYTIPGDRLLPESFNAAAYLSGEADGSKSKRFSVHRVSKRRASQAPAVQFLLRALTNVLLSAVHLPPGTTTPIASTTFLQGGVREGLLYSALPAQTQAEHPLRAATLLYEPPDAMQITNMLYKACGTYRASDPEKLPSQRSDDDSIAMCPLSTSLLEAAANLHLLHAPLPKDIRASAALRSTTAGALAGTHGLTHYERASVALILCERWRDDANIPNLSPPAPQSASESLGGIPATDQLFWRGLRRIVGAKVDWWARFAGLMLAWLGNMFPAGRMPDGDKPTFDANALQIEILSRELPGQVVLELSLSHASDALVQRAHDLKRNLEKLGKRKNWSVGFDYDGDSHDKPEEKSWGLGVECNIHIV